MKTTGLLFGSFNPVHMGHLMIANYFIEFTPVENLWLVVSPQNPLKKSSGLLPGPERLEMVRLALHDDPRFLACNIEFRLPEPSYTINTLTHLTAKYPDREFVLIMGADNLSTLSKWKDYQVLLEKYQIFVYPRPGYPAEKNIQHPNISLHEAPLIEISASFIRESIAQGKDMRFFLPHRVYDYITKKGFYSRKSR
ncbi:MAG: nicotinate (nicotinamide) nucleotide adenylyltransferase [Bacteroidales bacterium]